MYFFDAFSAEELAVNDKPFIIKGGLKNPESYITWADVENCMNNPALYELKDVGPFDDYYEPYYTYKNTWLIRHVIDKRRLFGSINNGNTLCIENYGYYNYQINTLLKEFETRFNVVCAAHVYCGLKGSRSFSTHSDVPANFILQISGNTPWKVFKQRSTGLLDITTSNNFAKLKNFTEEDIELETVLTPGDVLYIPSRQYHVALPNEPRISISVPCAHRGNMQVYDRNYYKLEI